MPLSLGDSGDLFSGQTILFVTPAALIAIGQLRLIAPVGPVILK